MARVYDSETTASNVVQDVADQINGKVVLTTGVSPGGLGAAFVESVASAQPALLILAGRSLAKVRETADTITTQHPNVKVRLLELDLGSLAAVRQAAEAVLSWNDVPKIDVLVNNAGVMGIEYARSDAGVEMTLAINHLGPFLLTNLLMNKLLAADKPRVVMLGSEGHRWNPIRWGDINFQDGASYNKWQAYGQSKTANMLMALALAEKLGYGPKKLLAFSVHPGFAPTHLDAHIAGGFASELPVIRGCSIVWFSSQNKADQVDAADALDLFLGNVEGPVPFRSPQHCAANHVFAAFSPDLDGKQSPLQGRQLQLFHLTMAFSPF